jgi:hypothetical protein
MRKPTLFPWFSLGLTLVDALDTAFLMNQNDIFKDARDWVETDLKFDWQVKRYYF